MNDLIRWIVENDSSAVIPETIVEEARAAGLLLHFEYQEESWTDSEGEDHVYVIRDDIYAATPGFVARYYAAGGTWGYA